VTMGEAKVDVLLAGVATSGLTVLFQDPDGAIASQAMTNSFGTAMGTIRSGAMVTVAMDSTNLITITKVEPGDHIVLNAPKPYDASVYGTISFTATSEATGKSYYRTELGEDNFVTTASAVSGTDRVLDVQRGNLDVNGKIHVVSGAYNASNQLVAYAFVTNYSPVQNGNLNVPFGANWKTDLINIEVSLGGAPSGATLFTVDSANEVAGLQFAPSRFGGTDSATVVTGGATVNVPYLGSFGDFIQTKATLKFGTTGETFKWMRRTARPAGSFAIGATDIPPRFNSPTVDATTATRPVVHWNVTGSGGDAIMFDVTWHDTAGGNYAWHVYAPPDTTTVTFPAVPTSLSTQSPRPTSIFDSVLMSHHDLEPLAGYSAFRIAPPTNYIKPEILPPGFTKWVRSEFLLTL
jgi:hypothetical protein